jgi:sec-independent protein translocase protein TatA
MGFGELVLILILVLLFFGASRLPAVGASLGKAVRSFRDATAGDPAATPPAKPEGRDAPGDRKP